MANFFFFFLFSIHPNENPKAEKESKISTVSELQKELDGQVALCDSLRGQLAEMPSKEEVEELKKHNRVLQVTWKKYCQISLDFKHYHL